MYLLSVCILLPMKCLFCRLPILLLGFFLFQKSDKIPTLAFSYQSNLGLYVSPQMEETGEEEGRGFKGKCKER